MKKTCLILGISGQDGSYLAEYLLSKGYRVTGSSRDIENTNLMNLHLLGIKDQCRLVSIDPLDFHSVQSAILEIKPDEIYHLASQSSVGLSFTQPIASIDSTILGVLNILEAVRFSNLPTRIYYASSSECFGASDEKINEKTPLVPLSPYGLGKTAASQAIRIYRESYGLFCVCGFLFNHESPLRSDRFVTKKIVQNAYLISQNRKKELVLGNLQIQRDWGWAPEYVRAMHLMLQQNEPTDYVVATGKTYTLEDFVKTAFEYFGLNYQDYVVSDPSLFRPNELVANNADPSKAARELNWKAKYAMPDVVGKMCAAEAAGTVV